MNEETQFVEIVLPDGTLCNPWLEDCPVGTDEDSYGTQQIALIGKNAAILYGAFAMLSALIPSVVWFADRQPKVDALKNNDLEVTKNGSADWPENLEVKFTDLDVVRHIVAQLPIDKVVARCDMVRVWFDLLAIFAIDECILRRFLALS